MSTLRKKKAAFTVELILDAACELTETLDISELSFKKVSEHADISQRTMFRYFSTREAFLDALTARLYEELDLPGIPDDANELVSYIDTLYRLLDAQPRKVTVLLSADLLPRIINTTAKTRLEELKTLLAAAYPDRSQELITMTAANLRYVMSASSWRYYREYFGFDLEQSIQCSALLVSQALAYLEAVESA